MMQERERRPYPFTSYLSGWYVLANSHEVPVGSVKSFHYFGKDIVIYRGDNKKIQVVDAYCPHLGAHLGKNGSVVGNNLRCPFHHWQYDESGKCVAIPYAEPQPKACLKKWLAVEKNGQILTYFSEDGSKPSYEAPILEELLEHKVKGWSASHFRKFEYHSCIPEVLENVVDLGHFIPVHKVQSFPEIKEVTFDGPFASLMYSTATKILHKVFASDIHFEYFGPAYTVVTINSMLKVKMAISITPINENKIRHRFHFRMKTINPLIDWFLLIIMAKNLESTFIGDVPIWEHKIYQEHPILCKGEGNIMKMRGWIKQFYPSQNTAANINNEIELRDAG